MFIYLSNKQAWISRHIQHPWPEQTTLNSTCNHFQGHQYLWITGRTNACHGADTILGKDWVSFVLMMARYKNGWGKTTSCWYFLSLSLTKLGCFKNLLWLRGKQVIMRTFLFPGGSWKKLRCMDIYGFCVGCIVAEKTRRFLMKPKFQPNGVM